MIESGFHNADCMKHMKEYPDNYFDLAIVDPPYGDGGVLQQTGIVQMAARAKDSAGGSTNTSDQRSRGIPRGGYHGKYQHGNAAEPGEHGRVNTPKKS